MSIYSDARVGLVMLGSVLQFLSEGIHSDTSLEP
jgi:hypothetical protein